METKTSWGILKDGLTEGIQQDSVGYQIQLYNAAKVFIALKENFVDKDAAKTEFNADSEVRAAFTYYAHFKKMGWTS